MKRVIFIIFVVVAAGCTPASAMLPTAASASMPTWTPQATYTPYPTNTSYPTYTPLPTYTPQPTAIPEATATPPPTATETASVPTSTDTPVLTATPKPTATPKAVIPIPPRGEYQHGYEITEEFDRFKNETVVQLRPRFSELRRGPNNLFIVYAYEGTTPAPPQGILFTLQCTGDSWTYLKCHHLTLLLDECIKMNLGTIHEGDVVGSSVLEYVASVLTTDEFLQIVSAEKVEGKLCNTEFVLDSEQMEALRDMASRMHPLEGADG